MRFEKGTGARLHRVEYQMEEGESLHAYAQLILDVASQRFALTDAGAGVDFAYEQHKLEARKILEDGSYSHQSSTHFVGLFYLFD